MFKPAISMHHALDVEAVFFFHDTATAEIYTLSLHDALPICCGSSARILRIRISSVPWTRSDGLLTRSEEHTSELQSRLHLVCRLLLEKKKTSLSMARQRFSSPRWHGP